MNEENVDAVLLQIILLAGPTLCASQYSQLQQERQYLAQVLCEQQCQKERFNRALANTESKVAGVKVP